MKTMYTCNSKIKTCTLFSNVLKYVHGITVLIIEYVFDLNLISLGEGAFTLPWMPCMPIEATLHLIYDFPQFWFYCHKMAALLKSLTIF